MVSSAVYRYFPTREDLLTALILEAYGALAEALSASEMPDSPGIPGADRWTALAGALREWALDHPHEFQLIYGTPIPGYVAPPETIPAAAAVAAPFLACVGSAWVDGFESFDGDGDAAGEGLRAVPEEFGIPTSTAAAVVAAISELVGLAAHELAGYFVGMAGPADQLYDAVVCGQVRRLGLGPESGDRAGA